VQVSSSEGVANHTVPESCAGTREGFGEALTGVRLGWVLSRENNTPGTPTLCIERKATRTGALARVPGRPGAVVDPSMCVSSLRGNREISPSARISKNPARIGKVMSRSR
jgi:RNA-directed DNA polymerase